MQNSDSLHYINKKVINLKSELLFREAEDDFYYFHNINSACKKLKMAVEYTPLHFKSIMLLADICFIKGFVKKALALYLNAQKIKPLNSRAIAAVCNCYYSLQDYKTALKYCNKAISYLRVDENLLLAELIEIKMNLLIKMKMYKTAYITFLEVKNIIDFNSLKSIYSLNYELINEKIQLQKKLQHSNLKIV